MENLLSQHKEDFTSVNLIPSSGGVFEITLDEELLFSKKELDRFPEENEIQKLVKEKLA